MNGTDWAQLSGWELCGLVFLVLFATGAAVLSWASDKALEDDTRGVDDEGRNW